MNLIRSSGFFAIAAGLLTLTACQSFSGPLPPQPTPPPAPPAQSQSDAPQTEEPQTQPALPSKRFRLGPAASALVALAQTQSRGGDSMAASATLERALRIEPDNPLIWIELGQLRLNENNPQQAIGMARKARGLAVGDPHAQAAAWRLTSEALRAQGRNLEADEAARQANSLSPQDAGR